MGLGASLDTTLMLRPRDPCHLIPMTLGAMRAELLVAIMLGLIGTVDRHANVVGLVTTELGQLSA